MQSLMDELNYPASHLYININKIQTEARGVIRGSFIVSDLNNTGRLQGRLRTNTSYIKVTPESFLNETNINYEINTEGYVEGDLLKTNIIVTSNGGEIILPVEIRISKSSLITKQGDVIDDLKDFALYCFERPYNAKRLFASQEFAYWLSKQENNYYPIYLNLMADDNKDRALDNFLLLSGYKNRAYVIAAKRLIKIEAAPNSSYTGIIEIQKKNWGFIEGSIIVKNPCPWLYLMKKDFSDLDFDKTDKFKLFFKADASKINGSIGISTIEFHANETIAEVDILLKKTAQINIELSKKSFRTDDYGELIITNHTDKEIEAFVYANGFVKLESQAYYVKDELNIPFRVKIGAFTHLSFKKSPFYYSSIYVKIGERTKELQVVAVNIV